MAEVPSFTNANLAEADRIWPVDSEPLYPAEPPTLNALLESAGVPIRLSPEAWHALLEQFRKTFVPFHPYYVPERVLLHVAHTLKHLGEAGGWTNLVEGMEEDPKAFVRRVMPASALNPVVQAAYGSRERMGELRKQAKERQKALHGKSREASPQKAAQQNPTPENPSSQTAPSPKASSPTAPHSPSQSTPRQSAPQQPEPVRGATENRSTPQGGNPDPFLLLKEAYRAGLLGRLAWHGGVAKATQNLLEDALAPLQDRLATLEERLHRLQESGATGGGDALQALEERLRSLEATMAEPTPKEDLRENLQSLQSSVGGLALLLKSLAQHVAELQALAFGPTRRPPLLPEEAIRMLESLAAGHGPQPDLLRRWLHQPEE